MSENNSIFRKAALEKLSSPEQLDVLMQVTSPIGWLALLAMTLIMIVIMLWSYFGVLPEKVMGQGILIKGASVLEVTSTTQGQVQELLVKPGDIVKKGQTIALIGQGSLNRKITTLKALIEETKGQHEHQAKMQQQNLELSIAALKEESKSREISTANLKKQVRSLAEKLNVQKQLFEKGLVTKTSVLTTEKELAATRSAIVQNNVRIAQVSSEIASHQRQQNEKQVSRENKIQQLRRELSELESKFEGSSKITSAYDGQVLELMVEQGNLVAPQTQILTLEALDNTLEAVLYIPATDGKRVQEGMDVRISPSTVKAEEFGFILGTVKSVSDFPTTLAGMRRVLHNEALVKELSGNSSRIEMVATLELDSSTPSGFKWSSSTGPETGVFSGTLCSSVVIVKKRRPLGLVIPLFRKAVGI